jgi:hypothetical protein
MLFGVTKYRDARIPVPFRSLPLLSLESHRQEQGQGPQPFLCNPVGVEWILGWQSKANLLEELQRAEAR